MAKKKGLSDKHAAVVRWYFHPDVSFNQTEAVRRAGFAHPNKYASRIFKRPDVQEAIQKKRKTLIEKADVTEDRIIAEYAKVAFTSLGQSLTILSDGTAYVDLTKLNSDQLDAIAEFVTDEYIEGKGDDGREVKKYRLKMHDKMKALDALARIHGMFQDNLNVSGQMTMVDRIMAGRKRAHTKNSKGKSEDE